jgi:hypothetical protein
LVANVETLVSSSLVISNAASQRPATPATSIWGPDMAMHEPIETRRRAVPGSNRSFGRVFSCFLLGRFVAARGRKIRLAIGHSVLVCFLVGGLFAPRLLSSLNRLWSWFLHRVVNPIVMFLICQEAVVPVGLILRASGKDLLRLKWEPAAKSYWTPREPPGPPLGTMSKQF